MGPDSSGARSADTEALTNPRPTIIFLFFFALSLPAAASSYELHLPALYSERMPANTDWKYTAGALYNWSLAPRVVFATVPDGTGFALGDALQADVHVYDRFSTTGVSAALCTVLPTTAGVSCGASKSTSTSATGFLTLTFTTASEFAAWDAYLSGFGYIRVSLNHVAGPLKAAGDGYRGADVTW